jgi:hypothetical protein
MKTKKVLPKNVNNKRITSKRISSPKKSLYSGKILFYSLLLLIGLLITVVASQQRQLAIQYAQTAPTPISSTSATPLFTTAPTLAPPTVTPTFGCLGTSCVGTIAPTGITAAPKPSPTAGVTIILPTNPNGKTPPGFFVSIIHRVSNWLSKFVRFGGNPPGNPNIPGTNINPVSSTSSGLSGAKIQGNRTITIIPGSNNSASGGGSVTPPATQPSVLQPFINLLNLLFKPNNIPPKK